MNGMKISAFSEFVDWLLALFASPRKNVMGQIPENPDLTLNRLNVSCEIGNLKQRKQDYIMLATQNGVKKIFHF